MKSDRRVSGFPDCPNCFGRHLCAYHEGWQDGQEAAETRLQQTVEYAVQSSDGRFTYPRLSRAAAEISARDSLSMRLVQRSVSGWFPVEENQQ